MSVEQSGELACVMLTCMVPACRQLFSEVVSKGRANEALHCFKLSFKTFGVRGWIPVVGLREFEWTVPVGRNGDGWVLGACVFMDGRFDRCECEES